MAELEAIKPETPSAASIALYQHILDEIKELRNERWKLAIYFTSVSIAIIALLKERELLSGYLILLAWLGSIIQIFSIILFFWLMVRNHHYLTRSRNIRRSLEGTMGLHEILGEDGQPILPRAWHNSPVSNFFEMIDITIPLILFTLISQVSTILLMAKHLCG
jgi:hypothetical protein